MAINLNINGSTVSLEAENSKETSVCLVHRINGKNMYLPAVEDGKTESSYWYDYTSTSPTLKFHKNGKDYAVATAKNERILSINRYSIDGRGSVNNYSYYGKVYYFQYIVSTAGYTYRKSKPTINVKNRYKYASSDNHYYELVGYFIDENPPTSNYKPDYSQTLSVDMSEEPEIEGLKFYDVYTKVGDVAIPAGTYDADTFCRLIDFYIGDNTGRTVKSAFNATVNGTTISVAANTTLYDFTLGVSPWDAKFIGFGNKAGSGTNAYNFKTYKSYCVKSGQSGGGSNALATCFAQYNSYPITLSAPIIFN